MRASARIAASGAGSEADARPVGFVGEHDQGNARLLRLRPALLEGRSLVDVPLEERKELLRSVHPRQRRREVPLARDRGRQGLLRGRRRAGPRGHRGQAAAVAIRDRAGGRAAGSRSRSGASRSWSSSATSRERARTRTSARSSWRSTRTASCATPARSAAASTRDARCAATRAGRLRRRRAARGRRAAHPGVRLAEPRHRHPRRVHASGPPTTCCARPRSRASSRTGPDDGGPRAAGAHEAGDRRGRGDGGRGREGHADSAPRSRRPTAAERGSAEPAAPKAQRRGAGQGAARPPSDPRPSRRARATVERLRCAPPTGVRGRQAAEAATPEELAALDAMTRDGIWAIGGHDDQPDQPRQGAVPRRAVHQARPDPLLRDRRAGAAAVPARPAAQRGAGRTASTGTHFWQKQIPSHAPEVGRALGLPRGGQRRVAHVRRRRPRGDDGLAGQPGDHRPAPLDVAAARLVPARPTR